MCEVLLKSVEWVNDKLGLERSLQFNELVTNQYETANQEYTPWHSDKSPLLGDEGLIVSLTLGAPALSLRANGIIRLKSAGNSAT